MLAAASGSASGAAMARGRMDRSRVEGFMVLNWSLAVGCDRIEDWSVF